MYKKASREKLRFSNSKGVLSLEQLWALSLPTLSQMIKDQLEVVKVKGSNDELSFLETNNVDPIEQLKFDILKDVYLTLKNEAEIAKNEAEDRLKKQKILQLIAVKQDQELMNKSIDELKAML